MIKLFIMKKIATLLFLAFIFNFSSSAQTVDLIANIDVTPPLNNGQTFTYDIMSTGNPYNAIRIKLVYNPSVIQLNSITPVYAFDFTPVNDTSTPGLVKYEAAELGTQVTVDATLFTLEFEVLDNTQNISIAHNYDAADGTVIVNSSGNAILGTANDILLETLSTQETAFLNLLSVYPNPAKNTLTIKGNAMQETISSITFHTIEGKEVIKQLVTSSFNEHQQMTIDTSSLSSALYFMTVRLQNGQSKVFKILIED